MYCNYNQISDNYYSAYKEELIMEKNHRKFYAFNTIIKALFILLSLILTTLISIYILNNILNINIIERFFQTQNRQTIAINQTKPIQIREEMSSVTLEETIKKSVPNLNMNERELALLIELIKSQITISSQTANLGNSTVSKNL